MAQDSVGSKTSPLRKFILENLGEDVLNQIEKRLIEKYGIGLGGAVKDFNKLDNVLREFFGEGAEELESKIKEIGRKQTEAKTELQNKLNNDIVLSVRNAIQKNLGQSTLDKIESRLKEKYQIGIFGAICDFEKLDGVLREFFGDGARGLETRILQEMAKSEVSEMVSS